MVIAIIGATGLVGRTILKILHERRLTDNAEIVLYASNKHAGDTICEGNNEYQIIELKDQTIRKDIDFALFSAGAQISKLWAKKFTQHGTIVIDNSSAFRRFKNIPLVVPEINFDDITPKTKIIANPNCSTIMLALPLHAINKYNKLKRVIVSTYQAVSGAGNNAISDLLNNTNNCFNQPITDNLLPHIDKFLDNGYTFEEDKLIFELKKILHIPDLKVTATAVRVPITNAHSESVNIELLKNITIKKLKQLLNSQSGVSIYDNIENLDYPTPRLARDKDNIFVGRIRKDYSSKNCYNFFLSADNLRKGAALNAVQILERLIEKNSSVK